LLAITPYVTRRTESFGVSIPEGEYGNEEFRKMRQGFAALAALAGVLSAAAMTFLLLKFRESVAPILIVMSLELIVLFLIYYYYHRKMAEYKRRASWKDQVSTQINVPLTDIKRASKKMASPAWFALYAVVIGTSLAVTLYLYPSLPDMIPKHFDLAGNVDRYAQKSMSAAMFMTGMQVFLAVVFWFVYVITLRARRMIDVEKPTESAEREMVFRAAMSRFAVFAGLLMVAVFSLMNFAVLGLFPVAVMSFATIGASLLIIAWVVVIAFRYGQGGSRIDPGREKGTMMNIRDDDSYWKLGVIYFNREDPSLFVEKRFGVGFTVNLARPLVWGITIALLAVCAAVMVLSFNLK